MCKHPSPTRAFWETPSTGILCFEEDVQIETLPDGVINAEKLTFSRLDKTVFARESGYYVEGEYVHFYLSRAQLSPQLRKSKKPFYVAGDFNHWDWKHTRPLALSSDKKAWVFAQSLKDFDDTSAFKFVHATGKWLTPPENSPNRVKDASGNWNLQLNLKQSGYHWVRFTCKTPQNLAYEPRMRFAESWLAIDTLPWALSLYSNQRLGAWVENGVSRFSLFAPRSRKVEVRVFKDGESRIYPLSVDQNGIWSTQVARDYSAYNYEYYVYNPERTRVNDPYAKILLGPDGPGKIFEPSPYKGHFKTAHVRDLVVLECHMRDVTGAKGFDDFSHFIKNHAYLHSLNCNALELLPITEYDASGVEEYQWGYMPAHYFAPSSNYGGADVNSVDALQHLVETCHVNDMAVILDVVFNHAGVFNSLLKIDKAYYFRTDMFGFSNASGCGNDFRAEAPMAKRLIIDSLIHFLTCYGVDGFRFDLAELLGVPVLEEISRRLKAIKQDVILIAEPWSFRGHAALDLKSTSFSYWNDGYRDFIPQYVSGNGNVEGLKYFMGGSTRFLCKNAWQSINYTESHDDYCWIDRITENPNHQGDCVTDVDRWRTHCMFAILFLSLGVPMLSAGQDFLKSKHGVCNTYNRPDCNRLDYTRWEMYAGTHSYVRGLIRLRATDYGNLLKIQRPSENYFKYFTAQNSSALVMLYNADHSCGPKQILFVINPHHTSVEFQLEARLLDGFVQIADTERICLQGLEAPLTSCLPDGHMRLTASSCAIWLSKPV